MSDFDEISVPADGTLSPAISGDVDTDGCGFTEEELAAAPAVELEDPEEDD